MSQSSPLADSPESQNNTNESSDIHRLTHHGKEIILIGTAHISKESVATVTRAIEQEQPDCVCVELDEQRYQTLKDRNRWEKLNILQVVKNGQVPFLMANLALASFQKRMGLQTGVKPGEELAAAAQTAEDHDIRVALVDRNIRVTLLRAWRKTGLWKKMNLVATLFAGMFEKQELDEEELSQLRQTDSLSSMLEEMGELLPAAKTILVDERDAWMTYHILQAAGEKTVAVVGAAHVPGIKRCLDDPPHDDAIGEMGTIPPKSALSKAIPWIIPAIVALMFIVGFFYGDRSRLMDAATAWVLANGALSALGAFIALGHPLTVLSAFIAAPLTSLNPTIGAGFVTALVQAMMAPPTVADMENVSDDIAQLRGWWCNRVTRVLLVFFLSSIGSTIGTFVAFGWLKDLI
ncbi:TraB/GumN family protein [Desulfuromonas acetoxidans]|uniref:TraB family protein n=1 Tax=Desulfuromonas acetoxidans (strain DSM 684 / 11070) TaxID=281689 RepID=Q1K2U0_DESA6|nr:TraB/GumN family protein [Desulfuromonas acetoxidans]EAT16791.1 TraB family protein [Desulfuromonas acetoxidans DSM 684]MBF0644661.1 TraB/GumN family protein [Desulfuromonas acetoxidans]NVD23732.1 TraB/GumN family protein [Desulfuromonas acetoxidans]NVE15871.1 TraB/GumN family protein [Desulfuromonas acetoxidans]